VQPSHSLKGYVRAWTKVQINRVPGFLQTAGRPPRTTGLTLSRPHQSNELHERLGRGGAITDHGWVLAGLSSDFMGVVAFDSGMLYHSNVFQGA